MLDGAVNASMAGGQPVQLHADEYAYFPPAGSGRHRQVLLLLLLLLLRAVRAVFWLLDNTKQPVLLGNQL